MNAVRISRQISLNSKNATIRDISGSNSTCVYHIDNMFKREPYMLYATISVSHAEIPMSFYIVNNTNNKLVISSIVYIIPFGNYNANTFRLKLQELLGNNFTINLESSTGKYIIINSVSSFTIDSGTTMHSFLGITRSLPTSETQEFISDIPVNFLGPKSFKISSQSIQTNRNMNSDGADESLINISANANQYDLLVFENTKKFELILYNDHLNMIDISITNEDNIPVDFNGIEYNLVLSVSYFSYLIPQNHEINV